MAQKSTIMVNKSLKTIGAMTLTTSIIWTLIGIYNALLAPGDVDVSAEILAPIDNKLETNTMESLAINREKIVLDSGLQQRLIQQNLSLGVEEDTEPEIVVQEEEIVDEEETAQINQVDVGGEVVESTDSASLEQ